MADRPSSSRLVDILWGLSIKRCQVGLCVPCGADGSVRLQCLWDAHQTPSLALNRRGGVRLGTVPSRSAAPEVTLPPLKKSPPILEASLSHSASAAEALGFIGLAAREPCGGQQVSRGESGDRNGEQSSPAGPILRRCFTERRRRSLRFHAAYVLFTACGRFRSKTVLTPATRLSLRWSRCQFVSVATR